MNFKEIFFVVKHKIPNVIIGKIKKNLVFAFWGRYPNFGDQMTPVLLRYYGFTPVFSRVTNSKIFPCAQIVSVGTILSYIPSNYNGIILGSGIDDEKKTFPYAKILALRGKLTQERLNIGNVILGDPGLLMKKIYNKHTKKTYQLCIIPHFVDKNHHIIKMWKKRFENENVKFIDVQKDVHIVVNEIKKCNYVISSSLHGLITADSFDIPNAMFTIRHEKRSKKDDFKFKDYYSVYEEEPYIYEANGKENLEFLISLTRTRNKNKKEKIINELDNLFSNLREYL